MAMFALSRTKPLAGTSGPFLSSKTDLSHCWASIISNQGPSLGKPKNLNFKEWVEGLRGGGP